MTNEKIFLDERGVMITNSRYIFSLSDGRKQTNALSGITAVSESRDYRIWILAGFIVFVGLCVMGASFLAGLVVAGIGAALFFFIKPKYWVVTTSASGAAKGFGIRDKAFVSKVVEALNEAIISRG
jgi:hypothetical protein